MRSPLVTGTNGSSGAWMSRTSTPGRRRRMSDTVASQAAITTTAVFAPRRTGSLLAFPVISNRDQVSLSKDRYQRGVAAALRLSDHAALREHDAHSDA